AARSRAEHLLADPMWVAGVVLYWAEGAKSRNRVSLANSDPRTLRLFVAWVRRYLNQDAHFSLHLHLHEGNEERAARRHWREVTGLDRSSVIKTTIQTARSGHRTSLHTQDRCTTRYIRTT